MKLINLINIADPTILMSLHGIKGENSYRYDFDKNSWISSPSEMTNEKLILISDFCKTAAFRMHKKDDIKTWSTMRTKNFKNLVGIKKDYILSVSIILI